MFHGKTHIIIVIVRILKIENKIFSFLGGLTVTYNHCYIPLLCLWKAIPPTHSEHRGHQGLLGGKGLKSTLIC